MMVGAVGRGTGVAFQTGGRLSKGPTMAAAPLYQVTRADVPIARDLLSEAFAHDPFFAYLLADIRRSDGVMRAIQRFTLQQGLAYGKVLAPSSRIEGVAIWLPSGEAGFTPWRALRSGILRLAGAFGARMGEGRQVIERMLRYEAFADDIRTRRAPERYWYLVSIAVADHYRGRGYASALLRPMIAECDREGIPCWLETHNPENRSLYEHYGFAVAEEAIIPQTETLHWAMVRPAQAGA